MTSSRPDDVLYGSVEDAAARYGVSTKTIRRWIADGRLTAYRVGPRLLRVDLNADAALVRPFDESA